MLKPRSKCMTFQQWLSYISSLLNSQCRWVEFIHFTCRELKSLHRNFSYLGNRKVTVLIAVPGSSLCAEATRHKSGSSISPRNTLLFLDDWLLHTNEFLTVVSGSMGHKQLGLLMGIHENPVLKPGLHSGIVIFHGVLWVQREIKMQSHKKRKKKLETSVKQP